MGMPACTITSQTEHGGIVTVGFPTVLIGFLPASRIGDLHVCPMFDGPVPHVGGPFILGSTTVIVGEMPQSRVTDQLTCVGPPDAALMGCETVLVGMAGGGGAAAAVVGAQVMGASVPTNPPATTTNPQATSEMQQDGTVKTSAPPGSPLPPIPLQSPGFPSLPAAETPKFTTAQPVDVPPGTTLYRVLGNPGGAVGSYWTPKLPTSEAQWRADNAVGGWNAGLLMAVAQVPAGGLKAWAGAASPMDGQSGGGTQVWTPRGALVPSQLTPAPWATPAQLTQLAAQQSAQAAAALSNAAQQAAQQAKQQAEQAAQLAAQGATQAAQQAAQQAQQAAARAQQAAQQAEKQGQQAVQQSQQAAQQAEQQAQNASAQGKAAAQQAAAQAQQAAKQIQQQTQQSTQQAQQAAQQAQQASQQAQQAAQQNLPKNL
ncbi:MAG TPA: PAAR domain-containing protein [Terracidiphilus sp.]|nr:PAAR domain-containing protein [Terracidiphilus sp.]